MSCCKNSTIIPEFKFALVEGLGEEFLPVKAEPFATGWDVRAACDVSLMNFKYQLIPLGLRCFAPEGWWLELRPRSSTFGKKHLHSLYGVIDQSYEGIIYYACQHIEGGISSTPSKIKKGDRIGQLVPYKVNDVSVTRVTNDEFDRLCKERGLSRGAGGFGSTG